MALKRFFLSASISRDFPARPAPLREIGLADQDGCRKRAPRHQRLRPQDPTGRAKLVDLCPLSRVRRGLLFAAHEEECVHVGNGLHPTVFEVSYCWLGNGRTVANKRKQGGFLYILKRTFCRSIFIFSFIILIDRAYHMPFFK